MTAHVVLVVYESSQATHIRLESATLAHVDLYNHVRHQLLIRGQRYHAGARARSIYYSIAVESIGYKNRFPIKCLTWYIGVELTGGGGVFRAGHGAAGSASFLSERAASWATCPPPHQCHYSCPKLY